MALLVNALGDAIRTKDVDKFNAFLDRACASATNGENTNNIVMLNSLKELLTKASASVNVKIQKAVNDKAAADMRLASECIIVTDCTTPQSVDLTSSSASGSSSPNDSSSTVDNAQFLEPRGRFNVSITNSGLLLQGKQGLFAPWSKVTHVARLPSHTSTKKDGEDVLAIKLVSENCVEMNGKAIKNLVWVLNNSVGLDGRRESDKISETFEGYWRKRIELPNRSIFQTITNQKAFIRCYNGLQEGGLYPLKCGIVFIKPLVFVPIEQIASVAAGRGGGTGNTRYVDLKV
jgi:hypothetical protein